MTYPNSIIADLLAENDALRNKQNKLLSALEAIEPFIPKSSAKEGGATAYSANVRAADAVREAIASAKGVA